MIESVIEKAKRVTGSVVTLILTVAGVVTAIYGATVFIDSRIEAKLNDPSTVRRIAWASRPEMIIDYKGSVLIDRGAMDYIANLKVVQNSKNRVVDSIVITPHKYMANPPLVTSVDANAVQALAERGQNLDWVIKLDYGSFQEDGPNRLRIEIIDR